MENSYIAFRGFVIVKYAGICRVVLISLISSLLIQGAIAVAPPGAPTLVIPSPTGDAGTVHTNVPALQDITDPVLLNIPLWVLILGILLIAGAAGGLLFLRRPAEYVPRTKRLQK